MSCGVSAQREWLTVEEEVWVRAYCAKLGAWHLTNATEAGLAADKALAAFEDRFKKPK